MNDSVENTSIDTKFHIKAIDGLRALAVLSVIVFHLNPKWLPGGFVGVDLFFVISGYVVTKSITGRAWSSAKEFFSIFLARRVARIYPALIFCLLFVGLAQTLLVPKAWLNDTSFKAGIAAFFGVSNFALVYLNDGYFSPRSEFNPFTHTWSLGVEEQFYILFAIAFWLTRKKTNYFLAFFAITIIGTLGISAWLTNSYASQAYYLLQSRWWELALGALLAHAHAAKHINPNTLNPKKSILFISLGIILISYGALSANIAKFPFPDALPVVIGGLLCIHGMMQGATKTFSLWLDSRFFVHIGRMSYSLYLWHWPVIVLMKWTIGIESWTNILICFLLTLVGAYGSFYLIEDPLRQGLIRKYKPKQLLVGGFITITLAAAISVLMYVYQSRISLSVTSNTASWYSRPTKSQIDWVTRSQKPALYAFGDSHAGMLAVALQTLEKNWQVDSKIISKPGCAVANIRTIPNESCQFFIESAIQRLIKQVQPGDIIILASLRAHRISDQWGLVDASQSIELPTDETIKYSEHIIERLMAAGYRVVLSAPLPVFAAPAFRCADWFNRSNPVCSPGLTVNRDDALKSRESVMSEIEKLSAKFPDLVIWDPFFDLCPKSTCEAIDDAPLFFDGDHLTADGNRRILPRLNEVIGKLQFR